MPMHQNSTRRIHHLAEHEAERMARPVPPDNDPGPISPKAAAHAKAVAQRSLSETRRLRHAALTLPCSEHEAVAGVYCFRTVKGICQRRLDSAAATLARSSHVGGEELHDFANAQRRANFHRAQRERGIR